MNETLLTQADLLAIYTAYFEAFTHCLWVEVAVGTTAALVLITLCCWQTLREARQRQRPPCLSQEQEYTAATIPVAVAASQAAELWEVKGRSRYAGLKPQAQPPRMKPSLTSSGLNV